MHLLVTALTLGLWGISWAALAIAQRRNAMALQGVLLAV